MTPAELQEWQRRMGFTSTAAAKALGLPPGTYAHYRYGTRRIPGTVELLCHKIEKENVK